MANTAELTHEYRPRGAAKDVLHCRDREVLMAGPAGTGKSRACLEKLHLLALANPGMRGLIVRKTLRSLGGTALDTWRKAVVNEALTTGLVRFHGGSSEMPAQYIYANGSVIVVGGLDTVGDQPPKIMSAEYDVIYVQEATELSESDWEALTTRLRNWRITFQQLIADCNPGPPTHWLHLRAMAGKVTMLHSRHTDNPRLYTDTGELADEAAKAYMAALHNLTGVRRLRLLDGIWAAAEGLVYDEFNPAIHLVDPFPIPDDWPRYWSIDFGYTNPASIGFYARDSDGRLYLYREMYKTQTMVEDHAANILKMVAPESKWIEPHPTAIICDHDAEGRATLERHLGLATTAADKTVTDGIQAVQARLRPAGDGKPRLFLFRDALVERDAQRADAKRPTCMLEEFPAYVWAVKPGGVLKEEPRKEDDHAMDQLRYVVAHLDRGGVSNIRWF